MTNSNIDFWMRIIENPSPLYKELFCKEAEYLSTRIPTGAQVLDIGCGDGRIISLMTNATQNIVGIDNDPLAIESAKRSLAEFPTIELVEGDALNIPFGDASFDVVVFMMTLVNFGSRKVDMLKEIARVLSSSGTLIVSVYSEDAENERLQMYTKIGLPIKSHEKGRFLFDAMESAGISEQFSKEELGELLESAGFQMVTVTKIEGLAYICEAKKINKF